MLLLGFAMPLAACGGPRDPSAYPGAGPVALEPPAALAPQVAAHQRITVRASDGGAAHAFEAALEKDGPRLTVVALTPMRTRLFTLIQGANHDDPAALEVATTSDEPLPFPPEVVVRDVQRVYFVRLPDAPLADGDHDGHGVGAAAMTETWSGGRLLERRYADGWRARFAPPGWDNAGPPPVVELVDEPHGYALTIETLHWQPLE